MAKQKKPKFDSSICKECAWYWMGASNTPYCHKGGKRIYYGECIEFEPKKEEPSELDRQAAAYETYQKEWN